MVQSVSGYFRQWRLFKQIGHFLLLESVIFDIDPALQPVWMANPRYRIPNFLQRGRNRDDLLHHRAQALQIVIPINERPRVHVTGIFSQPFSQEIAFDLVVC